MIPVEYIPETIYIKDALDLLTKKTGLILARFKKLSTFVVLHLIRYPLDWLIQSPWKPGSILIWKLLKNQVMKKIKLLMKNEDVQARLVIGGFIVTFALLALFFLNS